VKSRRSSIWRACARSAQSRRRNFSLPRWATVAASVVLGVTAGLLLQRLSSNDALTEYRGGTLLARGALARSLTEQLGGAAGGAGPVQAGLSFRAKTNDYCRTFVINDAKALAGLACRDGNDWQVVALTGLDSVPDRSQAYRMATSALPAPLLQAVNQRLSGEALDAQAEAAARARGWH
jgi:hypothetical protein